MHYVHAIFSIGVLVFPMFFIKSFSNFFNSEVTAMQFFLLESACNYLNFCRKQNFDFELILIKDFKCYCTVVNTKSSTGARLQIFAAC